MPVFPTHRVNKNGQNCNVHSSKVFKNENLDIFGSNFIKLEILAWGDNGKCAICHWAKAKVETFVWKIIKNELGLFFKNHSVVQTDFDSIVGKKLKRNIVDRRESNDKNENDCWQQAQKISGFMAKEENLLESAL